MQNGTKGCMVTHLYTYKRQFKSFQRNGMILKDDAKSRNKPIYCGTVYKSHYFHFIVIQNKLFLPYLLLYVIQNYQFRLHFLRKSKILLPKRFKRNIYLSIITKSRNSTDINNVYHSGILHLFFSVVSYWCCCLPTDSK